MYYEQVKPLTEFLNTKISYAERHKKEEAELLYEFVDEIAGMLELEEDKKDWYDLCNTIAPDDRDDNAIS